MAFYLINIILSASRLFYIYWSSLHYKYTFIYFSQRVAKVIFEWINNHLKCRFNKLGLDKVSGTEEPSSHCQVEEVHTFQPVQSAPLNVEKIVYVDIGTAHSVAVTGQSTSFTLQLNVLFWFKLRTDSQSMSMCPKCRERSVFHLWQ